jgi:hypothetical protein
MGNVDMKKLAALLRRTAISSRSSFLAPCCCAPRSCSAGTARSDPAAGDTFRLADEEEHIASALRRIDGAGE